ncbi:molybdenum cofactor guanylyltransferase MobA [Actinobacillus capsulatus]|uniref:molybdenum cofactor guanylyltransferase MobA n=1 Tax=Actinobacillus capsulatus TaxID=717 RepID=UPI00035D0766|nr:molybdenum cofactor guanylyltransferase MobA [Actinobacillus capsulatus]
MLRIDQISAVILAGGLARRMNGVEKGLQQLQGKPLILHIVEHLAPQIARIHLNINRSQAAYQTHFPQLPFYCDNLSGFQGPLSGMLAGFEKINSEYLLFVPCDTPFLPSNLVKKLSVTLAINQAQIAYVHDGERAHPTIALIHRSVAESLRHYLVSGERRLFQFFQTQKSVAVDFSEQKAAFQNINTFADLENVSLTATNTPKLLGITGYSGTGKTTLLEKLIPKLTACQIRVGLIKHSHHNVEVDKLGKDSHRLRIAGANPTMIVCEERWALMTETPTQAVDFQQLIAKFDPKAVDLILVEGFKHEPIAKIQLHRQAIEKPLPELDEWTIATATDYPLTRENRLDINDIEQIADFIQQWLKS